MAKEGGKERREYVRAHNSLPFTMTLLKDEAERQKAIAEVLSETADTPLDVLDSETDPTQAHIIEALAQVIEMVNDLSAKVDRLLILSEGKMAPPSPVHRLTLHDLSGGGFSFYADDAPKIGSFYQVVIDLSTMPLLRARCVCETKWVRPSDGHFLGASEVGMEIAQIREPERERIIRTVFRLQREELRARHASQ